MKQKILSTNGISIFLFAVLLGAFFINALFYTNVEDRVNALRGSASLLSDAISNSDDELASLEFWVGRGLNYSQYLNKELTVDKSTFSNVNKENFSIIMRNLQGYTTQLRYYSDLVLNLSGDLVNEEQILQSQGIMTKGTTFESTLVIANKLSVTTSQVESAYSELVAASENAKTGGESEMNTLRLKAIELTNNYYQADALISAAVVSLPAGNVNVLAPFVFVAVLYTVFLLFPWALLILFFFRKKSNLINSKILLLQSLNLLKEKNLENPADHTELTEKIDSQAFRSIEYLTSILILTIINGLLFYFVFYPSSSAGLAYLISTGGGVNAFASYLINEATPITFGFLGSYFFVLQMLLRRYFSCDLTPKAYTSAVVRTLTVFILSVVLSLLSSTLGWALIVASVAAFVVGIFPDVGVRFIVKTVNRLAGLLAPESLEQESLMLTKIKGLNIWHEARLLEEKVENIQNLATASLDDLIINTNFSPSQLIDWVDQALLMIHVDENWAPSFRAVGIRNATGLLCCVCDGKNITDEKIAEQVIALNKTQNTATPQMSKEILRSIVTTIYASRVFEPLMAYRNTDVSAKIIYQ